MNFHGILDIFKGKKGQNPLLTLNVPEISLGSMYLGLKILNGKKC